MSTEQLLCCCLSRWKLQGALSEELAETLESVDLREASGTAAHRKSKIVRYVMWVEESHSKSYRLRD